MRLLTAALLATIAAVPPARPAAADSVIIDMPPPPPARTDAAPGAATEVAPGNAADTAGPATAPAPARSEDVGEVALRRYGGDRVLPTSPRWRGWGYGYAPAYGFPYHGIGGYRVSLSPYRYYAYRAWNGGYVVPSWVYVRFGPYGRW